MRSRVDRATQPRLAKLQRQLGTRFSRPRLLAQALVHKSYANELAPGSPEVEDNERLEFLGDAVLSLVVSERLYQRLPQATEGDLTVFRSGLVRESTLARWARRLELGQFVKLARGEQIGGGRDREALLAQTFEAVLGALYLDGGLERACEFLDPFLSAELGPASTLRPTLDAKSRLQQLSQARFEAMPRYSLVEVSGPGHGPNFTVEVEAGPQVRARGEGRSKQSAEQAAAEQALALLEQASEREN